MNSGGNLGTPRSRRRFLQVGAAALLAAGPSMLNLGRFQVFADSPKKYSARAVKLVERSLVIDMESWIPTLVSALEAGLDIVSGMHARLEDTPGLRAAAERHHRRLINVRTPPRDITVGTGARRTGKRLLTVGTDCALGKKYTALALTRSFRARGVDADFRATGQTGIMRGSFRRDAIAHRRSQIQDLDRALRDQGVDLVGKGLLASAGENCRQGGPWA